jgi:hypothetical protein
METRNGRFRTNDGEFMNIIKISKYLRDFFRETQFKH